MKQLFYKILLSLIILFFLSGCGNTYQCYDALDWGSPTFTVTSTPANPITSGNYQIAPWQQTSYYLDGNQIYFIVQNSYNYIQSGGASNYYNNVNNYVPNGSDCSNVGEFNYGWSPWMYQSSTQNNCSAIQLVSQMMATQGLCQFASTGGGQLTCPMCPPVSENDSQNDGPCKNNSCAGLMTEDVPVANAPCFMNMGLGVYVSFTSSASANPNVPGSLIGPVVHLGQTSATQNNIFYSGGLPTGGVTMPAPPHCGELMCGVNFKILDKYYSDNYGASQITFISGIQSGNPGIITTVVAYIQSSLCWLRDVIFQNLIAESSFQTYIRALLLLYVTLYAITFLMGLVEVTQKDLIIRILKIAIIIQLVTTESSWNFFNGTFFQFFTQGVGEITSLLFGSAQGTMTNCPAGSTSCCPCNYMNLSGFEAFDNILTMLFSQATQAKMQSMITWQWALGSLYYVVVNLIFIVLCYALIKSVFVYIMSFLAMSLIIILAPIFIPFILFEFTKGLFTTWLKQLISYFIQPIVVLAFTFFMFQLVLNQVYVLFGYRTCTGPWWGWHSTVFNWGFEVYYWQADMGGTLGDLQTIAIPEFNYQCDDTPGCYNNPFDPNCHCVTCQPFECEGQRYPRYPYLDPLNASDMQRLTDLVNGTLIRFTDILMLMLLVWFMLKFNNLVPKIAKDLAGTPMQKADMNVAASEMLAAITAAAAAPVKGIYKAATGRDLAEDLGKITDNLTFKTARKGIGQIAYKGTKLASYIESSVVSLSPSSLTGKIISAKPLRSFISKSFFSKPGPKPEYETVNRGWYNKLNQARDTVGGFIDTAYNAPRRAGQQWLHDKTYGAFGTDHRAQDAKHKGGSYWNDIAEQHDINMELLSNNKVGKAVGKAYDAYFRYRTGSNIRVDDASSGPVVGGAPTRPTTAQNPAAAGATGPIPPAAPVPEAEDLGAAARRGVDARRPASSAHEDDEG